MKLLNKTTRDILKIILAFFLLSFFLLFIQLLCLFFLPSIQFYYLRENDGLRDGVIICVLYFIYGRFVFAKSKYFSHVNKILIFTIYWLLIVAVMLFNGGIDAVIYNVLFIPYMLSFGLGLFLSEKKSISSLAIQSVSMVIIIMISSLFLAQIHRQQVNFKNLTGKKNKEIKSEVVFFNEYDTINLGNQVNKVYVIDFWNNTCGACIKGFPKYRDLKLKHQDNQNVTFIIVNVYKNKKDIARANELLKINNLSDLETYFIHEKDVKDFEIEGFPVLVAVKNEKIIFRGYIETLSIFSRLYFN